MHDLIDSFQAPFFQRALLEAVLVGALAGVVGVHVLLRRLPFFVVAMSHATFPGVVIAAALGVSLFVGGTVAGLTVVFAVLAAGRHRAVDQSTAVGVVLAGAFAVGVLVQSAQPGSSRDLSAFLVGSIVTVDRGDLVLTVAAGVALLAVLAALHKELLLGAFDPAASAALGYRAGVLDAAVLVAVTVTVVVCLPAVGALLAVALLIVPALAARQCTDRVGPMMAIAACLGAASGAVGLSVSAVWDVAAGGAIALTTTAALAVTLAVGRARGGRSPLSRSQLAG